MGNHVLLQNPTPLVFNYAANYYRKSRRPETAAVVGEGSGLGRKTWKSVLQAQKMKQETVCEEPKNGDDGGVSSASCFCCYARADFLLVVVLLCMLLS